MKQEYLIMTQGEKTKGTAKISEVGGEFYAEVTLSAETDYAENEVFKAYIVCPKSQKVQYLGVLDGLFGKFTFSEELSPCGIVITKKSTSYGNEDYFCHGAQEGNLEGTLACYNNFHEGSLTPQSDIEKSYDEQPGEERKPNPQKEYVETSGMKLKKFLKDYKVERVGGYFLKIRSSLLEYILSDNEVKECISKWGYYILGLKETDSEKEFAVAVPSEEQCPFKVLEKYAFLVKGDILKGEVFWCIIAGTDKEGEYFKKF